MEQARQRVAAKGWDNVELIRARATDFDFPERVEAGFSTLALSLEPRFDEVIAKAAAALVPGGRFVLLDLRMPDNLLRHLAPALCWFGHSPSQRRSPNGSRGNHSGSTFPNTAIRKAISASST